MKAGMKNQENDGYYVIFLIFAIWYLYVLSISKFLSSDAFDADASQGSGTFRFVDEKLF